MRWSLFLPKPDIGIRDQQIWDTLESLGEAGRVTFPGRRADVRDAYRDCDVVICPSRRESFGRIAAEAMMNGLPVVASDIGPFRDLVSDKAGILFPVDDPNAAAAAIRNLAEDPVLRAELGRCAQVLAAKFEPGPIVRRFMELYGLKRSRDLESGGRVGQPSRWSVVDTAHHRTCAVLQLWPIPGRGIEQPSRAVVR